MSKIKVEICMGTTCYVLGASSLLQVQEALPAELASRVEIDGASCLELCKNGQFGKAPFVRVNGETISEATIPKLVQAIRRHAAATA